MENNEIKKDKIKNLELYYLKSVVLWIIMLVAVGGSLYFLWLAWKNDNTEDKTYVKYIGIGVPSIVAVISGLYSCISNLKSRNERFRDKQEQKIFEEKWNQKKIDADLKANAMIEWIQRVREATTAFVNSCYSMIRITSYTDKENTRNCFKSVNEKHIMLKLYFGPDDTGENDDIIKKIDDVANSAKSIFDEIVNEELLWKIKAYDSKIKSIDVDEYPIKVGEDEYGEDITDWYINENDPNYKKRLDLKKEKEQVKKEADEKRNDLEKKLNELVEELRKYLKNEWKKAKEGQ